MDMKNIKYTALALLAATTFFSRVTWSEFR